MDTNPTNPTRNDAVLELSDALEKAIKDLKHIAVGATKVNFPGTSEESAEKGAQLTGIIQRLTNCQRDLEALGGGLTHE